MALQTQPGLPLRLSVFPDRGRMSVDVPPVSGHSGVSLDDPSLDPNAGFFLLPSGCPHQVAGQDAAALVREALAGMELETGRVFGDPCRPLLLSLVRHKKEDGVGETMRIDHVGLGESTLPGLLDRAPDPGQVYAAYAHLILQFARILPPRGQRTGRNSRGSLYILLLRRMDEFLIGRGYRHRSQCTAEDWAYLSGTFKAMLRFASDASFPDDPWVQLWTLLSHWTAQDRYAESDASVGRCSRFIRVAAIA